MKPYHKNPRQITRKQMDNLRDWLAELGDLSGIVHDLNTDEIIGGNQRGMVFDVNKCEVELIDGPHEPDEQGTVAHGFIVWKGARYAYRQVRWDDKQAEKANIVANKAGGGWDFDILANEFEVSDLIEWGFDAAELGIDLTGGTDDDAEPQIDRAEELREQWGVESGQLWRLPSRTPGQEHRLICGDCTDAAVVERVMGGEKAGIALLDPPYGMRLDADFSGMVNNLKFAREKGVKNGRAYSDVIGDHSDYDARPLLSLINDVPEQIWFGANYYSSTLSDTEHGGAWLVWDKRLDESADKMFGSCFELMWSRAAHKQDILRHKWAGIFGTEHEPVRGRVHPNQKPVQLYIDLLSRYGGALVIDPYAGSGNTIIAAENLSRQCRAVEISPAYVAVALQRYVDAFGIEPELVTG